MGFHQVVLAIVLPIWVGAHNGAPRWIVAVAFLFSTVLCIVLQVSLGSKVDSCVTRGSRCAGPS